MEIFQQPTQATVSGGGGGGGSGHFESHPGIKGLF